MSTLTRRGFFGTLTALCAGAVAAVTAKSQARIALHPEAFALAMDTSGLRYIRQYDAVSDEWVSRYDWNVGPSQVKQLYFSESADMPMTPARFNRDILPVLRAEGYRS